MGIGLSFSDFPIAFVPLSASCLRPCLAVARYAFDKSDSQSVRQQNEIALDSNDRFWFKQALKEEQTAHLRPKSAGISPHRAVSHFLTGVAA